jgi:hypothetical protein
MVRVPAGELVVATPGKTHLLLLEVVVLAELNLRQEPVV